MRKVTDFVSKRVISESNDTVKYNYGLIIISKRIYFIPFDNTLKYPYYLKICTIEKIKTLEHTHMFKSNSLIDIRVDINTIFECIKSALIFYYGAIITDNNGDIYFYGNVHEMYDILRVLKANPSEVSEEDELKYENILRNTTWKGNLKVETF